MAGADIATLGLEIRSDGVATATRRLDSLNATAQNTGKATGNVSREMNNAERSMRATTNAANQLQKAMATLGLTLSAAYAVKTVLDFEKSMAQVKAITRATGAEFDALNAKAKELGRETRFSTAEAAEAMRFLAQAGLRTNEVLTASRDVLSLAQAGGLGLADAAEIASKALRSFQLEAEEMGRVSDLLAKTFTVANTNVQELGEAFRYVAPVATAFGVSMEDTTAAIAALSDAGISASMAGTGLRGILIRLSNPTKQAQRALEDAGLSMDQLNIKTKGFLPVLEALGKSSLTVEQAMTIFGQRAGPAFEVIRAAIPKTQQLSKEFQNISGFAKETAAIMDDNLEGALKQLGSAIEYLVIEFGEVSSITEGATKAIRSLAESIVTITNIAIAPYWDNAAIAIGLYIVATKAAALWAGNTTGFLAAQVSMLRTVGVNFGYASGAAAVFTTAVRSLGAALLGLAANPAFWILAIGSGLYMLYETIKANKAEEQRLIDSFNGIGDSAKYASEEMKILTETTEEAKVRKAKDALDEANKVLERRLSILEKLNIEQSELNSTFNTGSGRGNEAAAAGQSMRILFGDLQSIEQKIGTTREAMFGFKEETILAAKAIREMTAEYDPDATMAQKLKVVQKAQKTLNQLADQYKGSESIKNAQRELALFGGSLNDVVKKNQELLDAEGAFKKMADGADAAIDIIKELDDLLKAINKQTLIKPQTYSEAYEWLVQWTAQTNLTKMQQWELEQQTAATALEILEEAHAFAVSNNEMEKATTIWRQILDLRAKVSQVKPPKLDGLNKEADKIAKAYQTAIDKVEELQFKILELQYEINGASERELEVIRLKAQRQKELNDLYRRAAEATGQAYGNQSSSLNGPVGTVNAAGSSLGVSAGSSISSSIQKATDQAIAKGIKYGFGSRSTSTGKIDCSGWIVEINAGNAHVRKGGTAAGIIKQVSDMTGELLTTLQLTPDKVREGMFIGLDTGVKSWDKGRFKGIDHIVQTYIDKITGKMMVTESSSGKGVNTSSYEEWYRKWSKKAQLFGAGGVGVAGDTSSGNMAMQSARQVERAGDISVEALNNQITAAEALTNQYYDMKLEVAEFALGYDPAITQMEHGIAAMNAMGLSTDEATIRLKELQLAMLMDESNPSFGTEATIRQIELLNAEIQSLQNTMYQTGTQEEMQLAQEIERLNAAMSQGLITTEQYQLRLIDLGLQLASLHQTIGESTWTEDLNLALAHITEGYEGMFAGLSDSFGGFFADFTQGFSDSIGRAVVESESLSEALNNVAKSAVSNLISSLVQLGIQYVVNAALGQSVAAATMAATTAQGTATAAALAKAYAPAAAAASLASYGANAAPAMTGLAATYGMAQMLSTPVGFKEGGYTGNTGRNQIAGVVHGGEYVFDAEAVQRIGLSNLKSLQTGGVVSGPAAVIGRQSTANMLSSADSYSLPPKIIINNNGAPVSAAVQSWTRDEIRLEISDQIKSQVPGVVSSSIRNPNSLISKSLSSSTTVERKNSRR